MLTRLSALAALAVCAVPAALRAQEGPLDPLIAEGLQANLGIQRARLGARAAGAGVRAVRGAFLPTLEVDARWSELAGVIDIGTLVNPISATINQLVGEPRFPTDLAITFPLKQDMRLTSRLPLFNAALLANLGLARTQQRAARVRLDGAGRELAAGIQLRYLGLATAARSTELLEETLALVEENVRASERLVAAGGATPDVVARARADRSAVRQQLADAERQREAARRALNELLRRPLEAPVALVPDSLLLGPVEVSLDEALAASRARRDDLREAELGIRAADAQVRLAGAAFLPSVGLGVDYGFQGNRLRFGGDNDFTVASLTVRWNLFSGGSDRARRAQARLAAEDAVLRREELAQRIELEVRQAYDAVQVARTEIAAAADRAEAARRTWTLVRRRYEEGLAPHLELTQARVDATTAGLNEILTRFSYAARRVELERAAALRTVAP